MQVIISVGGRFHADHAARAAQKAEHVKRLFTTVPKLWAGKAAERIVGVIGDRQLNWTGEEEAVGSETNIG